MKALTFNLLLLSCIFATKSFASTPLSNIVYSEQSITLKSAQLLATKTLDACQKAGFRSVVTVVDHRGAQKVVLADDGSFPHALETSLRKARTAASRRIPSGSVIDDNDHEPTISDIFHSIGLTSLGGGLPIFKDGNVIGGVAVAGAPGENDAGEDYDILCIKQGLASLGLL